MHTNKIIKQANIKPSMKNEAKRAVEKYDNPASFKECLLMNLEIGLSTARPFFHLVY